MARLPTLDCPDILKVLKIWRRLKVRRGCVEEENVIGKVLFVNREKEKLVQWNTSVLYLANPATEYDIDDR